MSEPVDDLDDRLRSMLTDRADSAPDTVGLAQGARQRLAGRRRTTWVAVLAAVVLVAVPTALLTLTQGSDDRSVRPAPPTGTSTHERMPVRPGWHTETWRDLEIQVPNTWANTEPTDTCGGAVSTKPVVERPSTRVFVTSCRPQMRYGVRFRPAAGIDLDEDPGVAYRYSKGEGTRRYPEGAWVGVLAVSRNAAIQVVAPSEDEANLVLGSAHLVTDVDNNGCAPTADLSMGDGSAVLSGVISTDAISLCRYDVEAGPATVEPLALSARITGEDAQRLLDTIKASAVRANASARQCLRDPLGPAYLLRFGTEQIWVRPAGSCPPDGVVVDGAETRFLTPEILTLVARADPESGV